MKMTPQPNPAGVLDEAGAVAALKSNSPYRRREAVESLGILGVRTDLLFNALEDTNPWVRGAVGLAARRLSPDDAAGLVSVLINDSNPNVVVDALETAATLDLRQFVPQVLLAAQSADHRVKAAAIRTLGFIGPEHAGPVVRSGLQERSAKVRIRAAEVARALESVDLVDALSDTLSKEINEAEPHENLVATLCQALIACDKEAASGPSLLQALTQVPGVRSAVAKALAKMRFEGARTVFEQFAHSSDPETRALGIRSLGSLGVEPSWDVIVQATRDEELNVRLAGLRALGEAGEGMNLHERIQILARLALDAVEQLETMVADDGTPEPLADEARRALVAISGAGEGQEPTDWDFD